MSLITIALFFVYIYGLGFSITFFLKNSENFFEKHLMRLGIGLGVIPILGVLLNLLHIPIDWKIFLLLSLIMPCYALFKSKGKGIKIPSLKITKSNIAILVVLFLFFVTLFMYGKGAFAYDYLEDDDSWHHAQNVKYIAMEKTAYENKDFNVLSYTDPYPPGYGIVLGILHQTSSSVSWTIKFFNALIISLGIIFFYFFVKQFSGSRNKALLATFFLAAIPCYLSHFIWAHALIVTLFFPAFYCLERIQVDKKWFFAAMLVIAGVLTTHASQGLKFGMLFGIYWLVKVIVKRKAELHTLLAGAFGFVLSLMWWGAMIARFGGLKGLLTKLGFSGVSGHRIAEETGRKIYGAVGTGTRPYSFEDFFIAKTNNMINNPIGVGIVLCILLLVCLVFVVIKFKSLIKEKNSWMLISMLWLLFAFLGIHGGTKIPVALFSFRFWMLFAIPASIVAAQGAFMLGNMLKRVGISKIIVFGIIIIGVLFTSGYQKFYHNTSPGWPAGAWGYMQDETGRIFSPELDGYLWLKTLPLDTKVFAFTTGRSNYIIGFDKFMCVWCKEDMEFQEEAINKTAEQLNSWLKKEKYEYITMGGEEARIYGTDKTNEKVNEFISSGLFRPVHQTQGVIILKVV